MRHISLAVLLLTVVILGGCETLKGLGKDIEHTGQNIQDLLTREEAKYK